MLERNPATGPRGQKWTEPTRAAWSFSAASVSADAIRALGLPGRQSDGCVPADRMSEPPVAVLKFGSVAERRRSRGLHRRLAAAGTVSAGVAEQGRAAAARRSPSDAERDGSLWRRASRIRAGRAWRHGTGALRRGGGTAISSCLPGRLRRWRQHGAQAPGHQARGPGRHARNAPGDLLVRGSVRAHTGRQGPALQLRRRFGIVAQGDRKEFTLQRRCPRIPTSSPVLRGLIGFDCQLEIRKVITWRHNLLLAERYRDRPCLHGRRRDPPRDPDRRPGHEHRPGRCDRPVVETRRPSFTAGPAPACWRPTKPSAGRSVCTTSRLGLGGRRAWASGAALVTPQIREQAPPAMRCATRWRSFLVNHGRMHGMRGAEFGIVCGFAVIADEPGNSREWDTNVYRAACPTRGAAAAHMA